MKLQFSNRNLWILLKNRRRNRSFNDVASCLSECAGTNILLDARASLSNRFRELSCFTCNVEAMFETNPSTLSLLGIVDIRFGLVFDYHLLVYTFSFRSYTLHFVALHLVCICPLFQGIPSPPMQKSSIGIMYLRPHF